jgi:hypothetical protein
MAVSMSMVNMALVAQQGMPTGIFQYPFTGFNSPASVSGVSSISPVGIAYDSQTGNLVVVCNTSSGNLNYYIISTNGGVTWGTPTQITSASANILLGVATNGQGVFIAVGYNTSYYGTYLVSTNGGTTWTAPTKFNGASTGSIYGICYGNGKFVGVGSTLATVSSNAGTSWSTPTSTGVTGSLMSVCYGNGLYVAVGTNAGASGCITTSTDGVTWSSSITISGIYGLYGVTYSSTLGMFVAVGYTASTYYGSFVYSTNGTSWSTAAQMGTATDAEMRSVSVNLAGTFVAVGYSTTSPYPAMYSYSTNGTTWSTPSLMNGYSTVSEMITVTTIPNGRFVAAGTNLSNGSPTYIATSK